MSHHPPVAAGHAENSLWVYDIVSAPTTRFLGNSVEIFPVGESVMQHSIHRAAQMPGCHYMSSVLKLATGVDLARH